MSADNFMVIGHFPDGYRIGMSWESDYRPDDLKDRSPEKKKFLKRVFDGSEVYPDRDAAYDAMEAEIDRIESTGGYVEYGMEDWKYLENFN